MPPGGRDEVAAKKRFFEPGYVYHVLNRGAQRQQLFFSDENYRAFTELLDATLREIPLPIVAYELMPNHWHFVVKPDDKVQLSEFFQTLTGTHAKRFRAEHGTIGQGHVYQDRFKSFPVESDSHFLALCRYVERNALRAGLMDRAEAWQWSSLAPRLTGQDLLLTSDWPVPRPPDWIERVNRPLTSREVEAIRRCIRRGCPLGNIEWVQQTARELGLQHTLRSRGRPSTAKAR